MLRSILALAFLGSCLTGLAVVVPPQVLDADEQQSPDSYATSHFLHSAKQAVQPLVCEQPPCPPTALDEVKDFVHRGYQKTAETFEGAKHFVSDRIEAAKGSAEKASKHAADEVHDTADRTSNVLHETVDKAEHGVDSTADKVASFINVKEDKTSHSAEEPNLARYIMPGVSKSIDNLQRTFEEERHQIFSIVKDSPSMDALKRKAGGASFLHIGDSIEGLKKGVQETVKGAQEKASNVIECASGIACNARDKAGNLICGIKEKLITRTHTRDDGAGIEMKVHELCSAYGANRGMQKLGGAHAEDAAVLHESYTYFMQIATKAIDDAKQIFEKSAIEGGGIEWMEKYMYLVDSSKGALEGANHVFARAITTIEGDLVERQQEDHESALTRRLRATAARTKQRLSSAWHSLVGISYLASFAMAFGVALWTTFFAGHILSEGLPRQQLALVQSKLFPVYLSVITGCLLVCTLGHAILHPWLSASLEERLQIWNFSFSLIISLCSMFILEPKVTKVMFEKLRVEREDGRGQSGDSTNGAALNYPMSLHAKFRGLHQIASFANLLIIAGLSWHLWYLAHNLIG